MINPLRLVVLLAFAILAGCGTSPKASYYTLTRSPLPKPVTMAAATPPTYTIAIGAVAVPDVVDRPQFVTRTGLNQLTINEFARWGEPLKGEIARVIAADLAHELDGAFVSIYPQSAGSNADIRLQLDVRRFDSALGESATVEVVWTIRPLKGTALNGRSFVRETPGGAGYDALVAAHSRALAGVSRDIATAVKTLRSTQQNLPSG
jgi:uncharacterized lipoprotein YmbA